MKYCFWFLSALILMSSCTSQKYGTAEKTYKNNMKQFQKMLVEQPANSQIGAVNINQKEWIASTNFGIRKPNFIMIHHTAQNSLEQTIRTFQLERTMVSSHYVISRDGEVVQMVNDYARAHHAGGGKWGSITDMNSMSIGIEMDNNGTTDPWPEEQIDALIELLKILTVKYEIPPANFLAHADWAPARKVDPNKFPWKKLAENGFGYWYDETNLETPPSYFDPVLGLKIIGYDISNLSAAIRAFKIRYIQDDNHYEFLSERDTKVVWAIFSEMTK